jgi:type IV secretory pathway component VirB8
MRIKAILFSTCKILKQEHRQELMWKHKCFSYEQEMVRHWAVTETFKFYTRQVSSRSLNTTKFNVPRLDVMQNLWWLEHRRLP